MARPRVGRVRRKKLGSPAPITGGLVDTPWGGGTPDLKPMPGNPGGPTIGPGPATPTPGGSPHIGFLKAMHGALGGYLKQGDY